MTSLQIENILNQQPTFCGAKVIEITPYEFLIYDTPMWNNAIIHRLKKTFPHMTVELRSSKKSLSGFEVYLYLFPVEERLEWYLLPIPFFLLLSFFIHDRLLPWLTI